MLSGFCRGPDNPRNFEPEGKLMCSGAVDLRQTQPHQHDRTRYMLLQPPGSGFAIAKDEHGLKKMAAKCPSCDMADFKDPCTGELHVLAIRGGCTYRYAHCYFLASCSFVKCPG